MLEKIKMIDMIEVVNSGHVQVRTRISVVEDGKEIGSFLHRYVIAPGDDFSLENPRVKAICAAAHTAEVIAAYKNTLSSSE